MRSILLLVVYGLMIGVILAHSYVVMSTGVLLGIFAVVGMILWIVRPK